MSMNCVIMCVDKTIKVPTSGDRCVDVTGKLEVLKVWEQLIEESDFLNDLSYW